MVGETSGASGEARQVRSIKLRRAIRRDEVAVQRVKENDNDVLRNRHSLALLNVEQNIDRCVAFRIGADDGGGELRSASGRELAETVADFFA